MEILNKEELDTWLFEHASIQGHKCDSVKGPIQGVQPGDKSAEEVNRAWIDTVTCEKIDIIYKDA